MDDFRDPPAAPETGRPSLSALPGWAEDDPDAALAAFRENPDDALAVAAARAACGRTFFERHFRAGATIPGHVTGYYEPELDGSRTRSDAYPVPIHGLPEDGCAVPRDGIDVAMAGREIAWLRDEVDRFFLQVQGSGRIRLADGGTMRVGYGGSNGHPYRSIGALLVERGVFGPDITADALKDWLRADVARGRAVMAENPSYVFFVRSDAAPEIGPRGTLCPVTAGRSIAVDPEHVPLGTPVWIAVDGIARLCVAQDTGGAIRGAGRADLFFGTGAEAGRAAGRLNHAGTVTPLLRR